MGDPPTALARVPPFSGPNPQVFANRTFSVIWPVAAAIVARRLIVLTRRGIWIKQTIHRLDRAWSIRIGGYSGTSVEQRRTVQVATGRDVKRSARIE